MKRQIIEIDEEKCNGCGECIPNCPEGALQVIDGKARLISDLFCDGLGACIGECPLGAIKTVEREAEAYDEQTVMLKNIIPKGANTIKAHLKHLKDHKETKLLQIALDALKASNVEVPDWNEQAPKACGGGCPGTLAKLLSRKPAAEAETASTAIASELRQWPIQLHLINPMAAYFDDADLLISADCVPYSFGDFHRHYLKGKMVITFCPKLDNSMDIYLEKLTELFRQKSIKSVTIVRMEVPCCGGTEMVVRKALAASGKDLDVNVDVISLSGEIIV
ncbi:MAG: 4Fe-4S binding protein [Victivallales bacterium]|nr:4Fe-4S binding protein [Victivallales bacterium]